MKVKSTSLKLVAVGATIICVILVWTQRRGSDSHRNLVEAGSGETTKVAGDRNGKSPYSNLRGPGYWIDHLTTNFAGRLYENESAVAALAELGPDAVPALRAVLKGTPKLVQEYEKSIQRLPLRAQSIVPRLQTYSHEDQTAAINTLRRIGQRAEGGIPELLQLVSGGNLEIRLASATALGFVAAHTEKDEEVFNRLRTIEEELLNVTFTNKSPNTYAVILHGQLIFAIEKSLDRIAESMTHLGEEAQNVQD